MISKYEQFLILLALPTIIIFNILILLSDNSFSHWSMMGWMLLIPIASNHLILMKSFKVQLIIFKVLSALAAVILVASLINHARTGFITRSYGEKIPAWDDTRELLDWRLVADILAKNLQEEELDSLATLNWYDSGQLTVAFNYKHTVGVMGSNSNHFKYIKLNEKSFMTLIDIRLIHTNENSEIKEVFRGYGYNVINTMKLPLFRGNERYGIVNVFSIEKIGKKF